ncbi:MAG: AmmeMemoRadiSam system protein B [Candidatus Omnitrophica bacterium]|nr:AmmeMemoRadiSam system protein B [Candidatus Omnitrophota bacterium]MBU1869622.1 AmmeMemoRadiSam system protein B [Candidatus Omnitrophota bacterium]
MQSSKVREPVVAGQFYPASERSLRSQIESLIDKKTEKFDAIGCMLPHAGYPYSGKVAAETVSSINIKKNIILLGPNHTGYGSAFSIMTEGIWKTPLGEVKINSALAKAMLSGSKYLEEDYLAHAYEHSLEVELPFLQYFSTDFEIVPITFMSQDINALKCVGKEIAEAVNLLKIKGSVLIVASSDMTHYEPQEEALKKDKEAIKAILELNEDKLMKETARLDITMCGSAPTAVMLSAAKSLGANNAKLIKYQTSGDVTNDKDSVVGYAGIVVY